MSEDTCLVDMPTSKPLAEGAQLAPTLLLVGDQPTLLRALTFRLESCGYRVRTATSVHAALEALAEVHPDLIISDATVAMVDGFDLLQAVRSDPRWLSVPFVFLSARERTGTPENGVTLTTEAYIVKPFAPKDLLRAIEANLRRSRKLQEEALTGCADQHKTASRAQR